MSIRGRLARVERLLAGEHVIPQRLTCGYGIQQQPECKEIGPSENSGPRTGWGLGVQIMKPIALLGAAIAATALGGAVPQRPTNPPTEGRFQVLQVHYTVNDFTAGKMEQPEETLMLLDSATGDTWTYTKQVMLGKPPTGDPALDAVLAKMTDVQSFWTPVGRN